MSDRLERNKQSAMAFYDLLFNQCDPAEAVRKYVGDVYTQHNPLVADGKVIVGEVIDLTDQFRDGFVDSLQIETVDKTRFAAPRAERQGGRYTVFQSGVYTACEPCIIRSSTGAL